MSATVVIIENIPNRFPQIEQLTLLGYLDPRNSNEATFFNINELGLLMDMDGSKLYQEFTNYTHFVNSLSDKSRFDNIIAIFFNDSSRATMCAAYPMISNLLFRICVLPSGSAHIERLFSLKQIKKIG